MTAKSMLKMALVTMGVVFVVNNVQAATDLVKGF